MFFARVEWLYKVHKFLAFLKYYKTEVGAPYAKKFADKVLHATEQLAEFPELGVLKYDTLMGKHDFRALFIDQYVCIYKVEFDAIYIYHFTDARKIICTISLAWNNSSRAVSIKPHGLLCPPQMSSLNCTKFSSYISSLRA